MAWYYMLIYCRTMAYLMYVTFHFQNSEAEAKSATSNRRKSLRVFALLLLMAEFTRALEMYWHAHSRSRCSNTAIVADRP